MVGLVWATALAWAVDLDGDGHDTSVDCDDSDASVHPSASEGGSADGIDQDCSGTADDVAACGGAGSWLQAAVDGAPDGFVVRVCSGTHRQTVVLDRRRLTLRSDGSSADTTLDGRSTSLPVVVRGGSEVTIEGLTLLNGASSRNGGNLRCLDATLTLRDAVLSGGRAGNGGGLSAKDCEITVDGVLFKGNEASGNGGNVWVDGGGGHIESSRFVDGVALEGGGLWSESDLVVETSVFKGNTATSTANDYVGGGGAWIGGATAVRSSTFVRNHADMCGGGLYSRFGRGDVEGNVFQANTADDDGGGVYFDWTTAAFRQNLVLYNDATDDAGGLRIYRGAMVVEDNLVQGNTANDDGGGVKMSHADHVYRRNVHRDNHTGDAGGGLEMDNDTSDIEDCVFDANSAGRGGGLHSWRNEGEHHIQRTTFSANHATDCGGALAFDNDPHELELRWVTIDGSTSDDDGGALCIEARDQDDGTSDPSVIRLHQSSVSGAAAPDEGGFAKVEHGTLSVDQVVLRDLSAGQGSVALADDRGEVRVRNTIAEGASGGSVLDAELGGMLTITWSDLFDVSGGFGVVGDPTGTGGNIALDPLLGNDDRPGPGSPCVDVGDPSVLDDDGTRSDMGRFGGPGAE